jgi:hypothetical protein
LRQGIANRPEGKVHIDTDNKRAAAGGAVLADFLKGLTPQEAALMEAVKRPDTKVSGRAR